MKLPIPSFGKKEKQKYILALLLRDEKISALITEEVEGKMTIVGKHEEMLTTPLEHLTSEEWLDTLDRIISKAEETLPPNRETHDTVFGVKESWVEDKKIKKEYLLQLKKISEALDLTPIGFLVLSEAITHLIQAEEGAPVSAILVDIGKLSVTTTLVRGGKIIESKSITRDGSLPVTVDTALKHLQSVEVFPSRLILFQGNSPTGNNENNEHLAQEFIAHHWSKILPFLHPPQISVLSGGFDAKAVVQGAASQMGFEVLNLTLSPRDEIKTYDASDTHHATHDEKATSEFPRESHKKQAAHEKPAEEALSYTDQDFGFLMDQDVSEHPPVIKDNFDVVKQPDPAIIHHKENTDPMQHEPPVSTHDLPVYEVADEEEGKKNPKEGMFASLIANIPKALPIGAIQQSFGRLSVPSLLRSSAKKSLILPFGILLVLGFLYFFYTVSVKADITLYLKPNNVTENVAVLFSTESGNNFSENTINAETVSTELDGKVSTAATGKKAVGEKAKGSVTIYNNDDAKKQLSAGTTLSTDKGLKFTLDKDLTVASASGDIFSGTKPGTAQAAVTASDFGSDYNLPSNTKFNVNGVSNIAAKNDAAFSGGSKREVTVVAKKDQDKLIAELSKSLQENALAELGMKVSGDKRLLRFLTQASVTQKKFDKKVDDEAKTVTLTGTVSFEALTYSEKDSKDFAQVALKNKYSDNLNLSDKGVEVTLGNEKQKNESAVSAELTIKAGLIPRIDTSSLMVKIQGKPLPEAQKILQEIPQVAEAKIVMSPAIPLLPVSLPQDKERIRINISLNE